MMMFLRNFWRLRRIGGRWMYVYGKGHGHSYAYGKEPWR